jgi:hypothetical protein
MPQERKRPVAVERTPDSNPNSSGRDRPRYAVRGPDGKIGVLRKDYWSSFSGTGSRDSLSRRFDSENLVHPYEQDDRVFAVVSLIADAFAEVPLRIFEQDPLRVQGDDEAPEPIPDDHPLSILFETWNPIHDASLAQTAIAQGLCLRGEAPLFFTGAGGQRLEVYGQGPTAKIEVPEEVWPVGGELVSEQLDRTTGLVEEWRVRLGTGQKGYAPETVLVPRILHPRNPHRGYGPMAAAWGASAQNYLAERYRNATLRNSGEPGGLILVGEILDPEDYRRLKREIALEFDDPDASGKTKLLEGGATYQRTGLGPREMAYVESLAHNADRVAATFRVSKELLGQGESNFGARLREETEAFWRMRIIPWLRLLERSLNSFLFPRLVDPSMQGLRARFDLSKVEALRGDLTKKVELATKLQKSGVPLNVANRVAGLDVPDVPGGDVPLLVGSWQRLEALAGEEPVLEPEAEEGGEQTPDGPEGPAAVNVSDPEAAADPKLTLGAGQIASLIQLVTQVALGTLPRAAGVELIVAGYPFDRNRAEQILASIDEGSLEPSPTPGGEPIPVDDDLAPEEDAEERALRALESVGIIADRYAREVEIRDDDELDDVFGRWSRLANMTATDLKAWAENPCSRKASVDPAAVIKRNLRLLETPKSRWGAREIRDARRAISFIERMRANPAGEPAAEGCPSKRTISLRNWAHDPGGSKAAETSSRSSDEASRGDQTALERALKVDPLRTKEARLEFSQKAARRVQPHEREFRRKVRRVQDRMRRAQLRAIDRFVETGEVDREPQIEGWKESPAERTAGATSAALLRRAVADADGSRLAVTLEGPLVRAFLERRGRSVDWAETVLDRYLESKAGPLSSSDQALLDALVASAAQKYADELAGLVESTYAIAIADELVEVLRGLPIPTIDVRHPEVVRYLATKPILLADGVNSTIARQVRRTILFSAQEATSTGSLQRRLLEQHDLLTDAVRGIYSEARQRALAIARTEMASASNAARGIAIDDALERGVAVGVRWILGGGLPESLGGARRDAHAAVDGEVRDAEGTFSVGGERARWPHDSSLSAKNVVNCGCRAAAVVPDVPDDVVLPGEGPDDPPDAVGAPGAVPPSE